MRRIEPRSPITVSYRCPKSGQRRTRIVQRFVRVRGADRKAQRDDWFAEQMEKLAA